MLRIPAERRQRQHAAGATARPRAEPVRLRRAARGVSRACGCAGIRVVGLGRDWQVSAILAVQSGPPLYAQGGSRQQQHGQPGRQFGYDRPTRWIRYRAARRRVHDGRAFVIAPPFTFGNAGRNILIGPAFASLDAALSKGSGLGAARRLEVRLEVYNMFNRANLGLPEASWTVNLRPERLCRAGTDGADRCAVRVLGCGGATLARRGGSRLRREGAPRFAGGGRVGALATPARARRRSR